MKIYITESELRQIIRDVIAEGQGWNAVKDFYKDVKDNGIGQAADEMADYDFNDDAQGIKNWVKTGDPKAETPEGARKFYDKWGGATNNAEEGTPINTSLRGKLGRKMGAAAVVGGAKALKGLGKVRKVGRNFKHKVWQSDPNRRTFDYE